MSAAPPLAERLEPVHRELDTLAAEYGERARADNRPEDWQTWADLHAALMAVRSAQGRDARGRGYAAPPAPHGGDCCGRHGRGTT